MLLALEELHVCSLSRDPSDHALRVDPSQVVTLGCLVASLLHGSLLNGAS